MYYVLDNCCPDLASALEVKDLYQASGIAVEVLTEEEYFATLESIGILPLDNSHIY